MGGALPADSLHVSIKQGDWRDLPEGSSFELYEVPQKNIHVTGATWSMTLDPETVPSRFVAPGGQVDFILEAHDPASGTAGFHTVSATRVKSLLDGATGWLSADAPLPTGWVALSGAPSTETRAATPEVSTPTPGTDPGTDALEAHESQTIIPDTGELAGIPFELVQDPTGSAVDDEGAADTSFLLSKPAALDVSTSAPGNCREISGYRYDAQTTIATGYPVGGDESSLLYSSTLKTTSGTAVRMADGSFSESGTESTTDGWGADFLKDTRKRSYRTVITYGYYACYNVAGYYSYWVFPIKQPGAAFYYYLSSAPNWTRCQPVYNGVIWRREQADGNAYESSYGVKVKNYIGIEMFSRHNYNTSGKLRYHVTHGNKHVCGNNDTPGQAGKVQEKY